MRLCLKLRDQDQRAVVEKRGRRQAISSEKAKCKRQKVPWRGRRQSSRLLAPYAFNIGANKNRQTVVRFLAKLRELCLERKLKVILDFSESDVINAPAMLLFVAELDRIKRILKDDFSVSIENVRNRRVNQVLHQVGIYGLCDLKRPIFDEESSDLTVRHWRYATGERANAQTNKAFENIEGRLSPELAKGMWKGVSEAVVNSVQHAYVAPRGVNGPRMGHARWWMFSQEKDGELTVVVCDLGIGIPRSLPMEWEPSLLKRLYSALASEGDDVGAIRAALRVGATATGDTHRGKGLPQIWNALREVPNATIIILSNHGQLAWDGKKKEEIALDYASSISGTMIIWSVAIEDSQYDNRLT